MSDREDISLLKSQGDKLVQENRLPEARKIFTYIISKDANDVDALLRLSSINGILGFIDEAENCCRRVITINPDSCDAHVNLGNVLVQKGKYEEAIHHYKSALHIMPDYPLVLRNIAHAYLKQGKEGEAKTYIERNEEIKKDLHGSVIIVCTPGKVGSMTVAHSIHNFLNSAAPIVPVYHVHHLNRFEEKEAHVRANIPNPILSLEKLAEDKEIRDRIDKNPHLRVNLITLTRDPVARGVSRIFQMLDDFFPDWKAAYKQGQLDLKKVQSEMVKLNPDPSGWFDAQIKSVFEIDVFNEPFSHDSGYQIYSGKNNSKLLLIRLEDLSRIGEQAIYEFLKIKGFRFYSSNTSEYKEYSSLYKEFKKIPLPKNFLENMYSSRYAKKFYTEQEISNFYKRWYVE